MAKIKMLCPFSKELCQECPQYRGRHYYLCFYPKYRGYLGNAEEQTAQKSRIKRIKRKYQMPNLLPKSPTWLILNDFAEREKK